MLVKRGALLSAEFEAATMFVAPPNEAASEEALRGLIALVITLESALSSSPGSNFSLMYSFTDTPLSHTWLAHYIWRCNIHTMIDRIQSADTYGDATYINKFFYSTLVLKPAGWLVPAVLISETSFVFGSASVDSGKAMSWIFLVIA